MGLCNCSSFNLRSKVVNIAWTDFKLQISITNVLPKFLKFMPWPFSDQIINKIEDYHTFISDAEADVGVALVGGEEQVEEVWGADEELRDLCTLVTANQRGRRITSIPYLKNIIVNLCPESVDQNNAMHQHGSFTRKWESMDSSQSYSFMFLQDITY